MSAPRGSWVPAPQRARAVGAVGIALSVALVALGVASFPVGEVARSLAGADLKWLAMGGLVYLMPLPLRGLRWAALLRAVKPVSALTAAEVLSVGGLANNVMPARLGDVARAFVLAKKERVSASSSFATIMLERVFDGVTVVGLLLVVLVAAPPGAAWVKGVAGAMGLLFSGAIAVSALLAWNEARALSLARWAVRPLPAGLGEKLVGVMGKLAVGLHSLKSARVTVAVVGYSLAIWLFEAAVYVVVQWSLGLDIPPHGLVLVMAVLTLGLAAPSAPAFVGVFEGLVVAAVGVYGVEGAPALAYAIAMHLVHFTMVTSTGAVAAWRLGLRMRELREAPPPALALTDPALGGGERG